MNKKSTTNNALTYALTGLLMGGGTVALYQTLKDLAKQKSLHGHDRASLDSILVADSVRPRQKSDEDSPEPAQFAQRKVASLGDMLSHHIGKGFSAIGRGIKGTAETAAISSSDALAFAAALGLGGYATKQLFDKARVADEKAKADDLRNYYYSRLLDVKGGSPGAVVSQLSVPLRKTASNLPPNVVSWLLALSLPLSVGYVTKRYLDETQPRLERPSVSKDLDPRAQIKSVLRVPTRDEEKTDADYLEISDYLNKLKKQAAVDPARARAFDFIHLFSVLNANKKQASESQIPDVLRVVENEGIKMLKAAYQTNGLIGLLDYVDTCAQTLTKRASSTKRSSMLATELLASDSELREALFPVLVAEVVETYPTVIKQASSVTPELMEAVIGVSRIIYQDERNSVFGQQNLDTEKCATLHNFAETVDTIFSNTKNASEDLNEIRKFIFSA